MRFVNFDALPYMRNADWWVIPDEGGLSEPDFYTLSYADDGVTEMYRPFYDAMTELPNGTRRTVAQLTYTDVDEEFIYNWFGPDHVIETVESWPLNAWCEGFFMPDTNGDVEGSIFFYEVENGQWVLRHQHNFVVEEF